MIYIYRVISNSINIPEVTCVVANNIKDLKKENCIEFEGKSMYVLFITMGYPTDKYITNGIFEFDQAKALSKLGCKVIYAFVDVRSLRRRRKFGFERNNIDGIDIYGINIPLGRVPQKFLDCASVIGLKYIYKKILMEQGKPDIMHAHFINLGYIASILKRKVNIPLVITEHSSLINKSNIGGELFKKAYMSYRSADALIAVSPALANKIEENFNIKSIYIPNIVDTKLFNYSLLSSHEKFNFVSTGNLIYTKRMDLTIDAFRTAFLNKREVTLTIFGEGPERVKLQEMIDKYNLNDRVVLKGMCSRKVIAEQLNKSDCFVLASKTETFGVAYIEALSMGIPVIATKCGGPETFVNEINGKLVLVDDKKALVDALIYMYNNIDKFDNKAISEDIDRKFSQSEIASKLIKVYGKLINS
jgi:L-malate glycosyltransferase